ncbi:MAG: hypothetical protein ACPGUV_11930 [Polyangiales bacterium]
MSFVRGCHRRQTCFLSLAWLAQCQSPPQRIENHDDTLYAELLVPAFEGRPARSEAQEARVTALSIVLAGSGSTPEQAKDRLFERLRLWAAALLGSPHQCVAYGAEGRSADNWRTGDAFTNVLLNSNDVPQMVARRLLAATKHRFDAWRSALECRPVSLASTQGQALQVEMLAAQEAALQRLMTASVIEDWWKIP